MSSDTDMRHIELNRGLRLDLQGSPDQQITPGNEIGSLALTADDLPDFRPEFHVSCGDRVALGQLLCTDRGNEELGVTSPVAGIIERLETGRRRTLGLLSIQIDGTSEIRFPDSSASDRDSAQTALLKSGLWISLRTRPFNRIPVPRSVPADIFVTAINSDPLGADPRVVLSDIMPSFQAGLEVLQMLTDGLVYVCQSPGMPLATTPDGRIRNVGFSGLHPVGLAGTHIHHLSPVSRERTVWHLDYQDVAAIGELFVHGTLRTSRIVSLAGSGVDRPRLIRTLPGAKLTELLLGEVVPGQVTAYSGSVLSGHSSQWLGRYDSQISVLTSQAAPTVKPVWYNRLARHLAGNRAIVAEPWLESVTPLNILPVPLLRALTTGDLESAESLGCLELAAEDLATLSWVCPAQHDYGGMLEGCLRQIVGTVP